MLDPAKLKRGAEQWETFRIRGKEFVQYDYRHIDGELFSTVRPTLEQCREERRYWVSTREAL